jgi:preprotein translocase subunit SecY
MTAQFFGGTGLLIIVGVTLDTMRQVETFLLQRHYDGFLNKGKTTGRTSYRQSISNSALVSDTFLVWFYAVLGGLAIAGLAIFLIRS